MGRPKGFNQAKILSIVNILLKYPEGIWIRRIAREAKLNPTTVTKYIRGILTPALEISELGQKPLLTVVRLKPVVFEKLGQGMDFDHVLHTLNLIKQVSE